MYSQVEETSLMVICPFFAGNSVPLPGQRRVRGAQLPPRRSEMFGNVLIEPAIQQHVAHSRPNAHQVEAEEGKIVKPKTK